jgi:MFS family permease
MTSFLTATDYGSLIYASLGYGTTQILLLQSGYQVTALVMNVVAMFIVDRMKRNRLMAVGFFLCMTTLIVETALQKNFLNTTNSSGLAAAAAILFLYVTSYSLFLDGATYFYIAELWPSHLRSQGYALGIGAFAVTNIIWLQTAPTGFAHIHWRYYIIAIVFAAVGCVVALFVFPDTLHKPLEEIAALFGDDDLVVVYERDLRITKEGVLETVHGKGGSTEEIELA